MRQAGEGGSNETHFGGTPLHQSRVSAGVSHASHVSLRSRHRLSAARGIPKTDTRRPSPPLFFCPAVGGIYTVIKTKAPVTCAEYGDRYTLIGPLSYKSAPMEVEAIEWDKPTPVNEGEWAPFTALL